MKTTLDLPDDLMREVKICAAKEGRKLKDLIAESLRIGLVRRQGTDSTAGVIPSTDPGLQFPLIPCAPDAPATRMSIQELLRLEQETQTEEDFQRAGLSL